MAPARAVIFILCLLNGFGAAWSSDEHLQQLRQLDENIQQVKKSVLDLERDLNTFKQETLFPESQQFRLFLTMEVFDFDLSAVQVSANGQQLAKHEYTAREIYALRKGGVQELFLGNISPGVHTLQARFLGRFAESGETPYEKPIEVSFRKGAKAQWLELRIDGSPGQQLSVRVFEREASQ
ncbi:MAG: AraC family transcriptional regulator [Oceanococcus sp.]